MKRTKDDLLREAIEQAGYYISKDIAVTLDDNCDLSYAEQVALLLAREVARSRPDLLDAEPNKDLVYVVGKVKEFFDEWKRVLRNIALYFKG